MFANKEIEEDDMAKGLWLLKIFKKSKPKQNSVTKMSQNSLKRERIKIQKCDGNITNPIYN